MLRNRRLSAWSSTLIVVAAILLAVVLMNLIALQTRTRYDLTLTGQHQLSPRTSRLIERLPGRFDLVFAVDRSRVDQKSYDAIVDLLSGLARTNENIHFQSVDVGTSRGKAQFEALVHQLRERDRPIIERQSQRLTESAANFRTTAVDLESVSAGIESAALAVPTDRPDANTVRRLLQNGASLSRIAAQDLSRIADLIDQELATQDGMLPDTATIRDRIATDLDRIEDQLSMLGTELGRFGATETMPQAARQEAAPRARELLRARDLIATEADTLARLPRPAVFRVASALALGEALLVIGPPDVGITAIDRDALLPSIDGLVAAHVGVGGEVARRAEDLLTVALASLTLPHQPILIIVHAEVEPFVMKTPVFEQLIDRARSRSVDVLEWAIVAAPDHPTLDKLDPAGRRPRVYFIISPNSAASSAGGDANLTGARRATALARVVTDLIDGGQSILLSLNPSVFPTFGDADPIAAALAPFGLRPNTGTPIVTEQVTDRGRAIATTLTTPGSAGEHPIQRAIAALSTQLLWPIAIETDSRDDVQTVTLLEAPGSNSRWMETQWIGLWQAQPTAAAADVLAKFDEGRDQRRDSYTLAVAAERTLAGQEQRVICIGSNGWALDRVAQPRRAVDGRLIAINPGNLELLDASIAWLAFADDLIARSAASGNVPTVQAMSPAMTARLQWLILAGLPLGVLLAGVGWRIVRG